VVDVVVEPELGERRRRIAAADDGERLGVGHRLGHGAGAGGEPLVFEHAHRAVPEHHAGVHDHVAERRRRAGADVEALRAVGQTGAERGVLAVGGDAGDVLGQVDRLALGAGLVEKPLAGVDLIGFEQRVADRIALGGEEREAHRPADHQRVDHLEQRLDHTELVGDLGAAEHGHEGVLGRVAQAEEDLDLLLQQPPHRRRHVLRRPDDRRVRAVRRPEGIVDVAVDAVDESPRTPGRCRSRPGRSAVLQQLDVRCQLGETLPDRVHRVLRVGLTLRPAEVAGRHDVRRRVR
jgi:hypothetical protein